MAAPMPRLPPVTSTCLPLSAGSTIGFGPFLRHLRRTREIAIELIAPAEILVRPAHTLVAQLRRGMQRPIRVGQMRSRNRAQIGAARGDDAVGVIRFEDGADGYGRHAYFVAYAIGERRLVHAAIDRLR